MIETLIVLLGLFCPTPDLPSDDDVWSVLQAGGPSETIFGSSPYDFPTIPRDGDLTYKITVDPLYEDYADCFAAEVRSILNDPRSWAGVREAEIGETPNVWIILTPPGGACVFETRVASCASGPPGQGQVRINVQSWLNGRTDLSSIADARAHLVNHETGHMLGYGHEMCTVMGYPQWTPDHEGTFWDTKWPLCGLIVWPNQLGASEQGFHD